MNVYQRVVNDIINLDIPDARQGVVDDTIVDKINDLCTAYDESGDPQLTPCDFWDWSATM